MDKTIVKRCLENNKIKRPIFKNAIIAFLIGGLICLIGQTLLFLFEKKIGIKKEDSSVLMYIVVVGMTSIITGFGFFDKIGQFAGAGTLIPITGFANSMTSSALEAKSEGIVLGILSNMFKLAGAVIATGVVSAFITCLIIFIVR